MSEHEQHSDDLTGRVVYDPDGFKIGKLGQAWIGEHDERPRWVTVNTGLFGLRESFLPVRGLRLDEDGEIQTPYSKDHVKDAPSIEPSGRLDPAEQRRLAEHYAEQPVDDTAGSTSV
ncbi:PRC-barrel domain-containing protein [Umezawaea beigongshangensis]|uniref:PRC-barrel domain-containing protein n=1 Tax=Umezawaea beigongshangensis TaxID=2780383 RepID=UPI0018F14BB8|nr:PRC-barrel domain-containing protein [Umezawaea beigongshangensis]